MTNSKTTKRALFSSVVALLLCFTMLLGTTFAWFTDSAASGSNVITAGNLDIVVEYTLDGTTWKDLDGATDLFQKGLWEPGHTEVVLLKITNNGSLALKYAANMNIVSETVGKTKDNKDIVLSEILTVSTCTQQYTDGNGNIASGADIFPAMTFNSDGGVDGWIGYQTTSSFKAGNVLKNDKQLQPKESDYIAVKVDMAETVGNEANHNGINIPTINFGINVLATQYTYENDSFGNQYDKNATYDGQPPVGAVEVASADALRAAFATGGDVVLTSDISLPDDFEVAADTILYGSEGVTLSFKTAGDGSTNIGGVGKLTLKNVDTYSTGEVHANGHIVFDGGDHEWALLAVEGDSNVTIKSGNFVFTAFGKGHTWTPDIILAQNGTLNIEGGVITLDGHGDYSIHLGGYSSQPNNVTVNITGGTINSGVEDLFYTESGENNKNNTHVSISGGVFNLNSGKILTDTNTWGVPGEYADGIATITGGTFFTSRSDRIAAYVADGYELVGDTENGYVVSAK